MLQQHGMGFAGENTSTVCNVMRAALVKCGDKCSSIRLCRDPVISTSINYEGERRNLLAAFHPAHLTGINLISILEGYVLCMARAFYFDLISVISERRRQETDKFIDTESPRMKLRSLKLPNPQKWLLGYISSTPFSSPTPQGFPLLKAFLAQGISRKLFAKNGVSGSYVWAEINERRNPESEI
ncbi:hypothetical protein CEXT_42641 [Caerostris extrusa]|uniref:Uncharacterized protein n=1 Tax=Caerostris extrusa TaxID=172846 RepID=A0AAV4MYM4_CAEEX|nr:hypothetical protein CEXT_42641 [Caerostris extrusa]